ncbi:MAG: septum site-determining protein Ssd [Kineosporiaceae bacterium]
MTDRPDLRAVVASAAADVPGCRVVGVPAAEAAAVPGRFHAAVLGVDALAVLAPAGRPGGTCRMAAVAAQDDDLDPAWPAALAVGVELVAGPGRGDLAGWLRRLAAGPAGAVGVVGGRGGAGASTAAVALARAAATAAGGAVLVDADPVGGGLDLALGAEAAAGLRWPDLGDAQGAPPAGLLAALPVLDGVAVVSHGRERSDGGHRPDVAVTAAVVDACLAGGRPVVVDLPRRADDATRAVLSRCTLLVVVVPAEVRACAAAAALLDELGVAVPDVRLLVRGPAPAGLTAEDVAAAVGIPSFAEVRPEPGLAAALDRGERIAASARSPLRTWAAGVVATGPGAR